MSINPPSPTSSLATSAIRNLTPSFAAQSPSINVAPASLSHPQSMIQVVKQTPEILELRSIDKKLKITGDQIQRWKSKMRLVSEITLI